MGEFIIYAVAITAGAVLAKRCKPVLQEYAFKRAMRETERKRKAWAEGEKAFEASFKDGQYYA